MLLRYGNICRLSSSNVKNNTKPYSNLPGQAPSATFSSLVLAPSVTKASLKNTVHF